LVQSNVRSVIWSVPGYSGPFDLATVITAPVGRIAHKRTPAGVENASAFDRRQAKILKHATDVFCEKGYAAASMRDLSRASGMSLAGLYHYFESKEKLLYLIQKQTFSTILQQLRTQLSEVSDPEQRVRIFIQNHLEYFLANQRAMKVLSHEDEVLKNGYGAEVRAIKREYYRICVSLVEELKRQKGLESLASGNSRIAVLSLFGMVNWIYTWHNPRTDADADALSQQMGDIFLKGILHNGNKESVKSPRRRTRI
jgi:TetR/AcrR family transcriptional regulator, cholesterol catabolism regulator